MRVSAPVPGTVITTTTTVRRQKQEVCEHDYTRSEVKRHQVTAHQEKLGQAVEGQLCNASTGPMVTTDLTEL